MQSKRHSLYESLVGTLVGYVINLCVQLIVYPLYGATFTFFQNIQLCLIFLVVSLVRGYCIRRYFNRKVRNEQQV
jgi:hypothetical protein